MEGVQAMGWVVRVLRQGRGGVAGLVALVMVAATATAAAPPPYTYGEAWWMEAREDLETSLLLHFGPPTETAAERATRSGDEQRARQRAEAALLDFDAITETLRRERQAGDLGLERLDPEDMQFVPRPIPAEPDPGIVYDYSYNRRTFTLPPGGPQIVDGGRFGQALRCEGGPPLVLPAVQYSVPEAAGTPAHGGGDSVDFWMRIDRYPEQTAAVWEVFAGPPASRYGPRVAGARLLLHPDGRLQLELRHPHGNPSRHNRTAEQFDAIFESPGAELYTREPVPLGTWFHVYCYNAPPTVQGTDSPMGVYLALDGIQQASYISEPNNNYRFQGLGSGTWYIGNTHDGSMPFAGKIDQFRLLHRPKRFYARSEMPWVDPAGRRPLQFGEPYFLSDGTVFHASLDRGLELDFHAAVPDARIALLPEDAIDPDALAVPGIRGQGWLTGADVGFFRVPLTGLNARQGALEFWVRPENFDNFTRTWGPMPPQHLLHAVRLYGRDVRDGQIKRFAALQLPRAASHDGGPIDFHPGEWYHLVMEWGRHNTVFLNGHGWMRYWRAPQDVWDHVEPLYAEFGIDDDVTVMRGQRPQFVVDELVGYDYAPEPREIGQALRRWKGTLDPLPLYQSRITYRRRIMELDLELTAMFPLQRAPGSATVSLQRDGRTLWGPVTQPFADGKAIIPVQRNQPVEPGTYTFRYRLDDANGETVVETTEDWRYEPEWWVGNRIGILDWVPPPWTDITVDGAAFGTRMTTWRVQDDGLPQAIIADGRELLAAPVELREAGRRLRGEAFTLVEHTPVAAVWRSTFRGNTLDLEAVWRVEYEGLVRWELQVIPKAGETAPLSLVIPLKAEHATHFMELASHQQATTVHRVAGRDGGWRTSQDPGYAHANHLRRRRNESPLSREDYTGYGFWHVANLADRDRGLYWFADNAAGWQQSPTVPAQRIDIGDGTVRLVLNLVAEPVRIEGAVAPIVFGVLPHPARPLPAFHRILERVDRATEPVYSSAFFGVFAPWPVDPRSSGMAMFPRADPERPEEGPSYAFAERAAAIHKRGGAYGFRTMYLSKYWLSCRAGAYDGWEWRSGPMGTVTLNERFVEYLAWEMNEWIGRDIYDGIYVDENYPVPSTHLAAGHGVRLPDGSVQPGIQAWATRELFKRWRNIFHQHDKPPMLISHHTGSFPYHSVVFCDAFLDGEGRPTITAQSRGFVDAVPLTRAEIMQNAGLWGVTPFYMVSIWEGGLGMGKDWNPHTRWSWRMARNAMSLLAHFENATTFTDQGTLVYRHYWQDVLRWGAADLDAVPFVPYWRTDGLLEVEGQGDDVLVSFYRQPGKLLLVASNRTPEPRDIRITLNRERLGLAQALAVTHWDSGYEPPADGRDILSAAELEAMQQEARTASVSVDLLDREAIEATSIVDAFLEEESQLLRAAADAPRVEDGVLIVPVRPHDFRLVAME